jgi:hypothetical protein
MRKIIGFVLLAIGAALLAVAIVTTTWAPGVVKKTPLDVDTTTRLDGEAARLDATTGALGAARPVRVTSVTRVDSDASDDKNAAFVQVQCVVYTDAGTTPDCPEGESPSTFSIPEPDRFVTDRVSALAVDQSGYIADDLDVVQHDGVINKFPFDVKKSDYQYWDGATEQAWPAKFVDTKTIQGVETYHFSVTISDVAVDEIAAGTPGTYSQQLDMWVEPRTGAIIDQHQDQQRYLEDGTQAVDLQLAFTDNQVKTFAGDAKDNVAQLDMVTKTMPIVGFVGGALLLLAGAALILTGRRKPDSDMKAGHSKREPVTV